MNLGRIREYDVLVLTSLIWFLGKFVRYAFPPLFEPLQAGYGVSNAAVGAAFRDFMAVYALLQFPSGAIADRVGGGPGDRGARSWPVSGPPRALLISTPPSRCWRGDARDRRGDGRPKTVAIRLLAGVPGSDRASARCPRHRRRARRGGRARGGHPLRCRAARARRVPLGGPGADWRGLFVVVVGVIALALAVIFALRVPGRLPADADRGPEREGAGTERTRLPRVVRGPTARGVRARDIAFSFAYNGAVAFLPLYLSQAAGLSTATANLLYSALFAVTFVQLVSGDLSDRLGRFPVMVATLALAAAAASSASSPSRGGNRGGAGPIVLGALVVAFGLGSHGFRPVRGVYLIEALPERLAGGGLGVVRTLLMGAGALAPATVGAIADASGFRSAFGLLAGASRWQRSWRRDCGRQSEGQTRRRPKRPFPPARPSRMHVVVNAAQSVDGKLATRRREQLRISGPEDFDRVDRVRAAADAVLVGVGTVLADDPHLTLDVEDRRVERLRNGRPGNPPASSSTRPDGRRPTPGSSTTRRRPTCSSPRRRRRIAARP